MTPKQEGNIITVCFRKMTRAAVPRMALRGMLGAGSIQRCWHHAWPEVRARALHGRDRCHMAVPVIDVAFFFFIAGRHQFLLDAGKL